MMVEQKDFWYALRNPNKGDFHCFLRCRMKCTVPLKN